MVMKPFIHLTSPAAATPEGVFGWAKHTIEQITKWRWFDLLDQPIHDKPLYIMRINAAGDGVEYVPEELGLAGEDLTGKANQIIRVKPTEDGYFIDKEVLHSLIGASLVGLAGQPIRVNATEDGFVIEPAGYSVAFQTAAYTETAADGEILNYVTGTFTVTLPFAHLSNAKLHYKLMSADTLTIAADGTNLIDGLGTKVLAAQYDHVTLMSDGAARWLVMGA